MKKVVFLSRVSTFSQDTAMQTEELKKYASKQDWDVLRIFEEKVSGAAKNEDRTVLLEMIEFAIQNNVDTVAVWDLSRLSRSTFQMLRIINELHEAGINLFIHSFGINTLDANKQESPLSKLFITLLAEIASIERLSIKNRMMGGHRVWLQKQRENNSPVGRRKGSIKSVEKIIDENPEAVKLIRKGKCTIREIAVLTQKSPTTIIKVKKALSQQEIAA